MFCRNCGNQIEDNAKFCIHCGSLQDEPILDDETDVLDEPVDTQPAPQAPQQYYTQPAPAPQQNAPQFNAVPPQPVSAPQQSAPQFNAVPPQPNAPINPTAPVNTQNVANASKKSNGCIIGILIAVGIAVVLVIGIIIIGVIGASSSGGSDSGSDISYNTSSNSVVEDIPNSEYTEIFESNYIVESPALFIGLESRAFASVDADGIIDKMEFGYNDNTDTIKELIENIYYPISDFDDASVEQLEQRMIETFADADELDCCTVTHQTTSDYHIVTIHSTGLDNAVNLSALSQAQVITYDGFALTLSMDATANGLISSGYVER